MIIKSSDSFNYLNTLLRFFEWAFNAIDNILALFSKQLKCMFLLVYN